METTQLTFLVTEPDPDVLKIILDYLAMMGHRADGVQSWNAALEKARDRAYDIVVTDFHRKGEPRNGFLFLRQVWDLPGRSKQRAIVITRYDPTRPNQPEAEDYYALREFEIPIIHKPHLSRAQLIAAIESITRTQPTPASAPAR